MTDQTEQSITSPPADPLADPLAEPPGELEPAPGAEPAPPGAEAPAGPASGAATPEAPARPDPGASPALEMPDRAGGGEGAGDAAGEVPGAFETGLSAADRALDLLDKGGVVIWAIAVLSVVTLGLILLKVWRLSRDGAWRAARAEEAVAAWSRGNLTLAAEIAARGKGLRARLVAAAIAAVAERGGPTPEAREETTRIARRLLSETGSGLRALELIATIAPLLGLLGTVLGMIAAFQALQSAGARADPAALAGGIWEALLTTAAGMAVAIPASAALTWFESVADRLRHDMEDLATRIFTRPEGRQVAQAAE